MAERKVTLVLPEEQIQFLQAEAVRSHLSMADVVRRSIQKSKFLKELRDKGDKLTVEQPDGRLRDIEFLD